MLELGVNPAWQRMGLDSQDLPLPPAYEREVQDARCNRVTRLEDQDDIWRGSKRWKSLPEEEEKYYEGDYMHSEDFDLFASPEPWDTRERHVTQRQVERKHRKHTPKRKSVEEESEENPAWKVDSEVKTSKKNCTNEKFVSTFFLLLGLFLIFFIVGSVVAYLFFSSDTPTQTAVMCYPTRKTGGELNQWC